jgi:DNA polymerase-3 subunit chi
MGAAFFYHLTRTPLESTLAMLLGKSLAAGWRVAVRGCETERMVWLDRQLWQGGKDDFLPHGLAGGPHDAAQPVLLTTAKEMTNAACCLMAVDGADVAPEEVQRLERVCILFDGNTTASLDAARVQWKALTDAGCSAQYWSEASGQWEKKPEK